MRSADGWSGNICPSALLLLSLLLLASCGKNTSEGEGQDQIQTQTDPGQIQTQAEEPETERPYYDTKGADYGGASFGIWNFDNVTATGWIGIPFDLFVDEMNGDVLNDAVYERNLEVEKKLNISIGGTNMAQDFTPSLQKMTAAGDYGVAWSFPCSTMCRPCSAITSFFPFSPSKPLILRSRGGIRTATTR